MLPNLVFISNFVILMISFRNHFFIIIIIISSIFIKNMDF